MQLSKSLLLYDGVSRNNAGKLTNKIMSAKTHYPRRIVDVDSLGRENLR